MQTAYAVQSGETQRSEMEIRDLTEKYMALWSQHAIAEHTKLFTEDADLVNVVGMHLHGRQEIFDQHVQLHRTIFANSVSRIIDLSVHLLADEIALVHMNWEMKGAAQLPGWNVPEPRTGVMTLLWVNQGNGWRVRAVHNTDTLPVPALPNA